MSPRNWLRSWLWKRPLAPTRRPRTRLAVESLEDRTVPAYARLDSALPSHFDDFGYEEITADPFYSYHAVVGGAGGSTSGSTLNFEVKGNDLQFTLAPDYDGETGLVTVSVSGNLNYYANDSTPTAQAAGRIAIGQAGPFVALSRTGADSDSALGSTAFQAEIGSTFTVSLYAGGSIGPFEGFSDQYLDFRLDVGISVTAAPKPDLATDPTTGLSVSADGSGIDYTYSILDSSPAGGVPVAFYWASGPSQSDILTPDSPAYSTTLTGADATIDVHTKSLTWAQLGSKPTEATHLVMVLDPADANHADGLIEESDEGNNVASIELQTDLAIDPTNGLSLDPVSGDLTILYSVSSTTGQSLPATKGKAYWADAKGNLTYITEIDLNTSVGAQHATITALELAASHGPANASKLEVVLDPTDVDHPQGKIIESNEANNSATVSLHDVYVKDVTQLANGVAIRYKVTGDFPGGRPVIELLWGDTGRDLRDDMVAYSFQIDTTPGLHTETIHRSKFESPRPDQEFGQEYDSTALMAVADRTDAVAETNEKNNLAVLPLKYYRPEVAVAAPIVHLIGHPLAPIVVVKNPNYYPIQIRADVVVKGAVEVQGDGWTGNTTYVGGRGNQSGRVNSIASFTLPSHTMTWDWAPDLMPEFPISDEVLSGALLASKEATKAAASELLAGIADGIAFAIDDLKQIAVELRAARIVYKHVATYHVSVTTGAGNVVTQDLRIQLEVPSLAKKWYKIYLDTLRIMATTDLLPGPGIVEIHPFLSASIIILKGQLETKAGEAYTKALEASKP
jgi:hypothetical protein